MGQIGFSNYVYYPALFYETLSSYIDFGRGYLQCGGNEGDFPRSMIDVNEAHRRCRFSTLPLEALQLTLNSLRRSNLPYCELRLQIVSLWHLINPEKQVYRRPSCSVQINPGP